MAQTLAPFVLKDVTLSLALVDVGTGTAGTPVEFRCQLNRAELVPSAGGGAGEQSYETFCGPFTSGGGTTGSSWTLELSNFQAYQDVEDLSNFLFDNETRQAYYSLLPLGGAVASNKPAFEGTVTLVAQNIGGTAATYAVATVSLPCTAKPTKRVTAAAMADAAASRKAKDRDEDKVDA
jgi:hypothetical protein